MSGRFEITLERDPGGHSSQNVMWLLGNMVLIPIKTFLHGMDLLVKTMQGMQDAADRSLDVMAAGISARSNNVEEMVNTASAHGTELVAVSNTAAETHPADTRIADKHEISGKESAKMPDTNLSDDMLKLVRYKVLFIKRDYEWAFPEREELVFDNMTDSAFTAWKIAEFIQNLDRTPVPQKWREKQPLYPPNQESKNVDGRDGWVIHSLPESDKKFLRIYFEVLQRYAREKLKYEEDQLDALRGIREAIEKRGIPEPGVYTAGGAGKTSKPGAD